MSDPLLRNLRDPGSGTDATLLRVCWQAADEIERLRAALRRARAEGRGISDDRLRNAPERTGYERMFHSAVAALAEISDALGIPEDVASTANGNAEILHAIAELKARASHARDALREQRRERLRDAPGGDEPDDDGPCPDRRCTGF